MPPERVLRARPGELRARGRVLLNMQLISHRERKEREEREEEEDLAVAGRRRMLIAGKCDTRSSTLPKSGRGCSEARERL